MRIKSFVCVLFKVVCDGNATQQLQPFSNVPAYKTLHNGT